MDLDRLDMATKQRITVFQSHEVAHMWLVNLFALVLHGPQPPSRFGDITTMEWWDYLYLNEGFATLVCVHFHILRDYLHTIKMGEVIVVGVS